MKITDIDQNFLTETRVNEGPMRDATKRAIGRDWTNTLARWSGTAKGQQRVNQATKALFAGYKQWLGTSGLTVTQGSLKNYLTQIGFDANILSDDKLYEVGFGVPGSQNTQSFQNQQRLNTVRQAQASQRNAARRYNQDTTASAQNQQQNQNNDSQPEPDANDNKPLNRGQIIKAITKVIQATSAAGGKMPKALQKVLPPAA